MKALLLLKLNYGRSQGICLKGNSEYNLNKTIRMPNQTDGVRIKFSEMKKINLEKAVTVMFTRLNTKNLKSFMLQRS